MKLRVSDIPSAGLDLAAKSRDNAWFSDLVKEVYRKDFPQGKEAEMNLRCSRICDNVTLRGLIQVSLEPPCHRCLEPFSYSLSVPIELILAPFREGGSDPAEEVDLTDEDMNFSFYKGDFLDLRGILYEFLVLSIPIRYLCREECKGICLACGENLNHHTCSCTGGGGDPRLQALRQIKNVILLILLLGSGVAWAKPPKFFVGGGPQVGGFVNEIRRPGAGVILKGGYRFNDRLALHLDSGWTVTRQFDVFFHFLDLFPHVSYLVWRDLYVMGGGGLTLANSSSGTGVDGFSTTRGVTRLGFGGGAGVGYVVFKKKDLSIGMELEGVYRKIKSGSFFEPAVRLLLTYDF